MQNSSFSGAKLEPAYVPTSDEKALTIFPLVLTLVAPILTPLIIHLLKKDQSYYVAYQARESLNFSGNCNDCCYRAFYHCSWRFIY